MKKLTVILFFFVSFISYAKKQSSIGTVTASYLNIRPTPGTEFQEIGKLKKGSRIVIVSSKRVRGWRRPWYKILYKNQLGSSDRHGWVYSKWVDDLYSVAKGADELLGGVPNGPTVTGPCPSASGMSNDYNYNIDKVEIVPRGLNGIGPPIDGKTERRDCLFLHRKIREYGKKLQSKNFRGKGGALKRKAVTVHDAREHLKSLRRRYCSGGNRMIPLLRIVVHHTGIGDIQSAYFTGMKSVGDVAYSYMIGTHGSKQETRVFAGRPTEYTGYAHYQNGANADGISIAIPGNFNIVVPKAKTVDLLAGLVRKLVRDNPDINRVISHNDLFPPRGGTKECAGDNLVPHIRMLDAQVRSMRKSD